MQLGKFRNFTVRHRSAIGRPPQRTRKLETLLLTSGLSSTEASALRYSFAYDKKMPPDTGPVGRRTSKSTTDPAVSEMFVPSVVITICLQGFVSTAAVDRASILNYLPLATNRQQGIYSFCLETTSPLFSPPPTRKTTFPQNARIH